MNDTAMNINSLLKAAYAKDEEARLLRRTAGRELAKLRCEDPQRWHKQAGVDRRTGELLIDMSVGRVAS